MLRLTLRDVRTHWVRFILSILAVFLATAFVSGTFTLTRLLGNTIDQLNTSVASADVYVRGLEAEATADDGGGGGPGVAPSARPGTSSTSRSPRRSRRSTASPPPSRSCSASRTWWGRTGSP